MKKVSITKYQAFDWTMHNTLEACEKHEREAAEKIMCNLRQFPIVFPMQDRVTDCTAYFISSREEFDALKVYIDSHFPETFADDIEDEGDGWYVVEDDHCGYARIETLAEIIKDWGVVMEKIARNTMLFKEGE